MALSVVLEWGLFGAIFTTDKVSFMAFMSLWPERPRLVLDSRRDKISGQMESFMSGTRG